MSTSEDIRITRHIAENIKKVRIQKHFLQTEIAKKAGLNSNFYSKVERGDARPSAVTLTKIIRALGVKSSDILPI